MTSINPHEEDGARPRPAARFSVDPCHPSKDEQASRPESGAAAERAAGAAAAAVRIDLEPGEAPIAGDLGTAAILEHQVVALEVGTAASPVAIYRWTGQRVCTMLLTPVQAQVWARAGRLTLVTSTGEEHRLTVLAPEESAAARLGEHWPLHEPDGKMKRIAAAAVHDVGDLLTFPAWLARTAHLSGERNHELARLVTRICQTSPRTAIFYGQTFGPLHSKPEQSRPYDHKGLVGHEGYPREL